MRRTDWAFLSLDALRITAELRTADGALEPVSPDTLGAKVLKGNAPGRIWGLAKKQNLTGTDLSGQFGVVQRENLNDLLNGLDLAFELLYGRELAPPSPVAALDAQGARLLARTWPALDQSVASALNATRSGYVIVEADWGFGKTAWALRWVRASQARPPGEAVAVDDDGTAGLPALAGWAWAADCADDPEARETWRVQIGRAHV